ncbi:MAG TPA: hypothetical protein VHN37_06785 [Actinomycetota bacterium]|nr:hypothetical protein [Actinomycetota bacterium]
MTRVKKIARLVFALSALWMVGGANWPADDVLELLGGMPCC